MPKEYISDYIGEEYKNWPEDSSIIITSPTGSGKSTFVLQDLLPFAAKQGKYVIYLCNRRILREQIKESKLPESKRKLERCFGADSVSTLPEDLEKYIVITSYQACEQQGRFPTIMVPEDPAPPMCPGYQKISPNQVMYYVFDEAHYFGTDSAFNKNTGFWTDSSRMDFKGTKVFLTATPDLLYLFLHRRHLDPAHQLGPYQMIWKLLSELKTKREKEEVYRLEVAFRHDESGQNRHSAESHFKIGEMSPETKQEIVEVNNLRYEVWTKAVADALQPPEDGSDVRLYDLPRSYEHVSPYFFHEFGDIIPLIKQDPMRKWLIFTNKDEGRRLEAVLNYGKEMPCAVFLSRENLQKREQNKQAFLSLVNDRCVEEQVLIATQVLDNGIDIEDERLTEIVIDHCDKTTFLQMLGRKRIKDAERVNLYIKAAGIKKINGFRKMALEELEYTVLHERKKDPYVLDGSNHLLPSIDSDKGARYFVTKEQNKRKIDSFYNDRYFNNFENYLRMFYRPQDGSGWESAKRMNEHFNEFEVNRCAVLHSAYMLYQYHTAILQYHASGKDENFFLKQQLAWIGKKYDETAWVDYQEKVDAKEKTIQILQDLLYTKCENSVELSGEDQAAFAKQCQELLQRPEMKIEALQCSKYTVKKQKNGIGKNLLNKAFDELALGYLISSKQVGRGQDRHMVWYVTKKDSD